jgi:hypothetical protein
VYGRNDNIEQIIQMQNILFHLVKVRTIHRAIVKH